MNNSFITGMIILLTFQLLGEMIQVLFTLLIPGPIIGLSLLLLFLFIKKSSIKALDVAVENLLRYLPLLLIPAASGIITQFDLLSKEFIPLSISLIVGTFISLMISMKALDILISKKDKS